MRQEHIDRRLHVELHFERADRGRLADQAMQGAYGAKRDQADASEVFGGGIVKDD